MAVAPKIQGLAGKWQIPLLAVSIGLFVAGLLQLRPEVVKTTVGEILEAVRLEMQAERFERASDALTRLLNSDQISVAQRAEGHRMLAETIWGAEVDRYRHSPENAERIIENFAIAERLGKPLQPEDSLKIAHANDWLGRTAEAADWYRKAVDVEGVDRAVVLERLIEILLAAPDRDWLWIDKRIDELYAAATGRPEALLRAVQWKMQRLLEANDIDGAQQLLAEVEPRLDVPPWSHHLESFRAQILFRQEQYEQAEARLRVLQGGLDRSDPLYAEAGYLLGRINYIENRPDVALSFYDEIVRTHVGTEYWLACLVGKAEALAILQRYAAAAEEYEQAVDALGSNHGSMLVDQAAIRQSLRTLGTVLSQQGRPEEAIPFAEMAVRLVPPEQDDLLADLLELEARAHVQVAEKWLDEDEILSANLMPVAGVEAPAVDPQEGASSPIDRDLERREQRDRAREHLALAGELYGRVADLRVLEADLAEQAAWQGARCFDRAGRLEHSIEAWRAFAKGYPTSAHVPEAMHRLGLALQARPDPAAAIEVYEDLLNWFGRTPAAFASLVPLARCHIGLGEDSYGRAEKVLLSVVEEDPSRPPLFTPKAPEFRAALMELANLYIRWQRPERAIERLEQALALYPDTPEINRLEYQLADAYRRSGQAMLTDADKTDETFNRDGFTHEAHRRLLRAQELFDHVASRLDVKADELSPSELVYLKTGYVYRADCAFDTGQYGPAADLYGRVAWRWQNDPVALAAYVQIVRSHLAAGDPDAAQSALARARWVLRKIPDEKFDEPPGPRTRQYWQDLFDWVEQSGLMAGRGGGST